MEKLSYNENISVRLNNVIRFETEFKLIKLSQATSSLGFNDKIWHEGSISKIPDFDCFFSFRVLKPNLDIMVKAYKKMTNIKYVLQKNKTVPLITYQ